MRCEEAQSLMDGYLDGELDLVRNLELERHIESCPECAPVRASALQLRSAIREEVPYFRAPRALAERVHATARQAGGPAPAVSQRPIISWQWIGAAAAILLLVLLGLKFGRGWVGANREELLAQAIVDGHVRSLMANHLMDVASTDQHTVKPWFDGKLDFAPPVIDLAQAGYPLAGGRLDYLDNHPVAALVYRRRLHYVNLFVWPSAEKENRAPAVQTLHGYNIVHWTQNGMEEWAVSDVSEDDLQNFAALLRK